MYIYIAATLGAPPALHLGCSTHQTENKSDRIVQGSRSDIITSYNNSSSHLSISHFIIKVIK